MAAREQSTEKYLENPHSFKRNAGVMISKMLELNILRQDGDKQLVEEILHSIFFLGRMMTSPTSPEEILGNKDFSAELKKQYPLPFDLCSSQLPRRSPFSCVLDMIVFLEEQEKEGQEKEGPEKEGPEKEGQKKEDAIIKKLHKIIKPLKQKDLVSRAICVSQNMNNQNSACRYYGVSMSKMNIELRRIMISASCLEYWDSYVAGAVMTYHPNDRSSLDFVIQNPDFDGTITLPQHVRCDTFNLDKVGKVYMPPCRNCQNIFGLPSTSPDKGKPEKFPYGNCAEAESVSKLFTEDSEIRKKARPISEKATDDNRKMDAERVRLREDLRKRLRENDRFTWDDTFYKPQPAV